MIKILLAIAAINAVIQFLILKQNKTIMATVQQLQDALNTLQQAVDTKQQEVIDEIKSLKDQIAQGGTVTEADLDGLLTTVEGIRTDIETTDLG